MADRVLRCPRCPGEELDVVEHDRHRIDLCGSCRGMWLDAAEWSPVIGSAASPARLAAVGGMSAESPSCPACTSTTMLAPKLQSRMIIGADDVVIDACPTCHGAWLDGGELARLRQSLAASRARIPSGPPPPPLGSAPPSPPGAQAGPGPKDAGRYQTMGQAMLTTAGAALTMLLEMSSRPPRRRGFFGRRRRRRSGGGLIGFLIGLLRK